MALSTTDPSGLANLSTCFLCTIPSGMQLAVQTYLLATIAGVDTSSAGIQTLLQNAAPFESTVPMGMQLAVQNYLLVQLLS